MSLVIYTYIQMFVYMSTNKHLKSNTHIYIYICLHLHSLHPAGYSALQLFSILSCKQGQTLACSQDLLWVVGRSSLTSCATSLRLGSGIHSNWDILPGVSHLEPQPHPTLHIGQSRSSWPDSANPSSRRAVKSDGMRRWPTIAPGG